jgi:hypothetical protein
VVKLFRLVLVNCSLQNQVLLTFEVDFADVNVVLNGRCPGILHSGLVVDSNAVQELVRWEILG